MKELVTRQIHSLLPNKRSDFHHNLSENDIGFSIYHLFEQCIDAFYQGSFDQCWKCSDILLDILWEKLNTGNWKDVSISWRNAYSIATLFKVLTNLMIDENLYKSERDLLSEAMKICDMGMLMGAPVLDNILQKVVDILQYHLHRSNAGLCDEASIKRKTCEHSDNPVPAKIPLLDKNNEIERVSCPSLESFRIKYLRSNKPVILTNCVSHWPAMRLWSVDYIKRIAGPRTVPIEIGSQYTDQDWSQKLMTISEFIEKYILCDNEVGYLAQHQLFNQIPDLEKDIIVPDYCCLGDDDVDINAWFGPKHTVSPLHYDPKHNFLVQVIGEKYIRLYDEKCTPLLYPHPDKLLFNTSRVDVENPDLNSYPDFSKAEYSECILRPGEMLYIPPKCWHYVRSLSVSFSVSFWWTYSGDDVDGKICDT